MGLRFVFRLVRVSLIVILLFSLCVCRIKVVLVRIRCVILGRIASMDLMKFSVVGFILFIGFIILVLIVFF